MLRQHRQHRAQLVAQRLQLARLGGGFFCIRGSNAARCFIDRHQTLTAICQGSLVAVDLQQPFLGRGLLGATKLQTIGQRLFVGLFEGQDRGPPAGQFAVKPGNLLHEILQRLTGNRGAHGDVFAQNQGHHLIGDGCGQGGGGGLKANPHDGGLRRAARGRDGDPVTQIFDDLVGGQPAGRFGRGIDLQPVCHLDQGVAGQDALLNDLQLLACGHPHR